MVLHLSYCNSGYQPKETESCKSSSGNELFEIEYDFNTSEEQITSEDMMGINEKVLVSTFWFFFFGYAPYFLHQDKHHICGYDS